MVTRTKCESPSFAPITAITSSSGSSSTPQPRWVPLGRAEPKVRHTARRRVTMVPAVLGRLTDLLDDVRRRRDVGVAHTEIDHVLAGRARGMTQTGHLGQHVGRKTLQLVEIVAKCGHREPLGRSTRARRRCAKGPSLLDKQGPSHGHESPSNRLSRAFAPTASRKAGPRPGPQATRGIPGVAPP